MQGSIDPKMMVLILFFMLQKDLQYTNYKFKLIILVTFAKFAENIQIREISKSIKKAFLEFLKYLLLSKLKKSP